MGALMLFVAWALAVAVALLARSLTDYGGGPPSGLQE